MTRDNLTSSLRSPAGLMKEFDRIARNPYSGDRVEIECEHCPLDPEEEEDETHSPGETVND